MSIREAMPSDVPAMLDIYREYVERTAVSFEYLTPTVEEFTRRLEEHKQMHPWFVWEEDGAVLGYAYAGRAFERAAYEWNAEISCYLKKRGQGIGKRLYTAMERILQKQGYRKIFAVVTSANAASIGFHKAIGYKEAVVYRDVGFKHGAWYDVIWLEKLLCPPGMPEAFPCSWREIAWETLL